MTTARATTPVPTELIDPDLCHPNVWWSEDHNMGVFTPGQGHHEAEFVRNTPILFAYRPAPHLFLDAKSIGESQYYPGDCIERKHSTGYAVELVLAGRGELLVNRQRYELRPGDVFILHPHEHHRYRAAGHELWRKQYVTFWPHDERIRAVMQTVGLATVSHVRLDAARHARCADLFARMRAVARAAAPGFRAELSCLVHQLLLDVVAVLHDLDQVSRVPEPVARAVHMAERAGNARLKVADLARAAGRSTTHLSRLFQQTFGMGTHEWLEKFRLRNAAILLRNSGKRLYEVAEEVGYDDPFYFSIAFKRIAGISPSDYRRLARLDRLSAMRRGRGRPVPHTARRKR